MKVLSVNVGQPEEILWRGRRIRTAFRKRPVPGRVEVRGVNADGDDQADRTVHGGPRKSLYAYPHEHYAYWRDVLARRELPFGAFGENLTTQGCRESDVAVGDRLQAGSAILVVTQPRSPCFKANVVFGRDDMVGLIHRSRRTGFYLGIERPGSIGPGDRIERLSRDPSAPTIAELAAEEPAEGWRVPEPPKLIADPGRTCGPT